MLRPNQFLAALPELLMGLTRLNILAVTYNNVTGFKNGPADSGKPGLTVTVQNGDLHYSPESGEIALALMMTPGLENSQLGNALGEQMAGMMDREARLAQAQLERRISSDIITDDVPTLALVYAGLSAFKEAVNFARKLKADHPNAILVILTCDCEEGPKERELGQLIEQGIVNLAVVTGECGGRDTMEGLLRAMIEQWGA